MPSSAVYDNTALLRDRRLLAPLNLAALVTWAAVAFAALGLDHPDSSLLHARDWRPWLGAGCLLAFVLLFLTVALLCDDRERETWAPRVLALLQGACAIAANALLGEGMIIILLILVAVQLAGRFRPWAVVAWLALLNLGFVAVWYRPGNLPQVLLELLPVLGFQAFAGLTSHYALAAERSRDALLQVNAELMATRALLDESARGEERLRLSRELHDIAGHSLTALKLNLGTALRDTQLKEREDLRIASRLADELLDQIRQVVSALRMHDGLDLRAALAALAQPLPGARIELKIEDQLRVEDLDRAEALLRCAQESITNALRHGRANLIRIDLCRGERGIELRIENDGRAPAAIAFGNGLTGMRERLQAVGGSLEVDALPERGLRVLACIPERAA